MSATTTNESYLPAGLPIPVPEGDGVADLMVRVVGMHTLTLDDLTL